MYAFSLLCWVMLCIYLVGILEHLSLKSNESKISFNAFEIVTSPPNKTYTMLVFVYFYNLMN